VTVPIALVLSPLAVQEAGNPPYQRVEHTDESVTVDVAVAVLVVRLPSAAIVAKVAVAVPVWVASTLAVHV